MMLYTFDVCSDENLYLLLLWHYLETGGVSGKLFFWN